MKVPNLFGDNRLDLPGGGLLKVPDLFGGSRSDLPGGGALVFLICSVAANQICLVVAHWSS